MTPTAAPYRGQNAKQLQERAWRAGLCDVKNGQTRKSELNNICSVGHTSADEVQEFETLNYEDATCPKRNRIELETRIAF
jgi:hypothetical protein